MDARAADELVAKRLVAVAAPRLFERHVRLTGDLGHLGDEGSVRRVLHLHVIQALQGRVPHGEPELGRRDVAEHSPHDWRVHAEKRLREP